MNAKKIFQLLAIAVLLISSPMTGQSQQQSQGKMDSGRPGHQAWTSGDYVVEWPYPQVGDRPSHYPPYYRDTQ